MGNQSTGWGWWFSKANPLTQLHTYFCPPIQETTGSLFSAILYSGITLPWPGVCGCRDLGNPWTGFLLVSHIAFFHVASSDLGPEGGWWARTSFTGSKRINTTCSLALQGLWEIICGWSSQLCLSRHRRSKVPENLPCTLPDLCLGVQCKSVILSTTFFPYADEVPWVL